MPSPPLRVVVSGGGPVGLAFALLLDDMLGDGVAITVFDGRWALEDGAGGGVVWKAKNRATGRRQQIVTVQSRQWARLPAPIQERLFGAGRYTEMWPTGPDSVDGLVPRNLRIADVEDEMLRLANERDITLEPRWFDAAGSATVAQHHALVISEGDRSRTREHFADRFGHADRTMYSLGDQHVQDVVLGLRVKSDLSDPMAVLLTIGQNRFLLNSQHGEGFLNMRLTDAEAAEAVGIDPAHATFVDCVQAHPCLMERTAAGPFSCSTHDTVFLPALLPGSPLWRRVQEGLRLFGVAEQNLSAITCFRIAMVQRPRFSAQLFPPTASTPGTFGFLLGDTANAIHIWPGRGLNSGLAAATSLARSLAGWRGTAWRDADFTRHEGVMAMLQYRHKSRAWRQMVTTDATGQPVPIKDRIAAAVAVAELDQSDRHEDLDALLQRLRYIRARLATRLPELPDDARLRAHLEQLAPETVHTLLKSGAWDSAAVGGAELDVDWLLPPADRTRPGSRE